MPDADWWLALWPDPAKVVAEMGVQRGMVVIDLCCGDGLFTAALAQIANSVYAIDMDPACWMTPGSRLLLPGNRTASSSWGTR
jgi:protein-L-isoaspartate O-methyltransferase